MRGASKRTDGNQPRVFDMQLSFAVAYDKLEMAEMSHGDEAPLYYGFGDHSKYGYAPVGQGCYVEQPYRWKKANMICVISFSPPKILKISVQDRPFKDDDCYNFYSKMQEPPDHAPNLNGEAVTKLLYPTNARYFFHDLLGRAGRAKNPQKSHFHPDIPRAFAAEGIREMKLPPQGHYFSPQEPINRDIQNYARKWRPREREDENNTNYGPQTFMEVEMMLNDMLIDIRKVDENGDTKERRWVTSAYHTRGDSHYFYNEMQKLSEGLEKAYNEVKRKRNTIRRKTKFTVLFDRLDGKGPRAIECHNLDMDKKKLKRVGYREKLAAKRQPPCRVTPEEEICQWIAPSGPSQAVGTGGAVV
mgnify:FL=1